MNGFGGNDDQLEVGHMLGLRWFTLSAAEHDIQRVYESVDVSAFGDRGQVYVTGQPHYRCKCGWQSASPPFPPDHPQGGAVPVQGGAVPVLRGARGTWYPGENEASCLRGGYSSGGHEPPDRHCLCGFWAYWSLGGVQVPDPAVVGLIKGYGRYEWGELGFRCGRAKILAVHLPYWDQGAALAIEDRYQCDVYSNFAVMLHMFRDQTPAGQPPLTDDYFRHRASRPPDVVTTMSQLRSFATACTGCGHRRCAPGQNLCAFCQVYGVPVPAAQVRTRTLDGREALKQAHEMRAKWAQATRAIVEVSASAEQATAKLADLAAALRGYGKKTGSPPDGRRY